MDAIYHKLFVMIARAIELSAETLLEQEQKTNNEKGIEAATTMRKNFADLHDKLEKNEALEKVDYANLLIGCTIIISQLEKKIQNEQTALQGYKTDTLPKLKRVVETKDNDEAIKLANEIFQTKSDSNS